MKLTSELAWFAAIVIGQAIAIFSILGAIAYIQRIW
jgi:hypothetical protein